MRAASLSALLLVAPVLGAPLAAAEPPPSSGMVAVRYSGPQATDRVAVPIPTVLVSGRVLMKDGVTPVKDAELVFTGMVDEERRVARSQRSGKYKIGLPLGQHALQIDHRMEIYRSPSTYRIVVGKGLEIDFLLVPDFEESENGVPEPATRRRGPDPLPEAPIAKGTVVDMVQSSGDGGRRGWRELLGFLGGILAVAVASD